MSENPIESQTTISEPGTYTLARDVDGGGGTRLSQAFITIETDDVRIDGGGRQLVGNGVSDTVGIIATDVRNVVIENLTLSKWDYGVRFENVVDGRLRNVRAVDNGYGLSFDDSQEVTVRDGQVSENLLGVVLDQTSRIRQENNEVRGNVGTDVYRSTVCLD